MKVNQMIRGGVSAALALGVAGWSLTAGAQEVKIKTVVPSDTQIQLYSEGAQAFQQEDYPKAIRLFKASLDLGELNITYLNLGRAYFKSGECKEAERHYALALTSPQIAEPTPAQVQAKVEEYRRDLQSQCPGAVTVQCDPAGMMLEFDGEAPVACRAEPWPLKPGRHVIIGQAGGQTAIQKVDVVAMQPATVTLKIEPKAEVTPPPGGGTSGGGFTTLEMTGLITAGGGGALLLGALVYDLGVLGPRFDEYEEAAANGAANYDSLKSDVESGQTTVLVLTGVGAAAVVTGGVLYFLGGEEAPKAEAAGIEVTPLVGVGSVGVMGRW